jgi:hypothetical protein
VEDRDTDERRLTAPGGGAPILNSHDGNLIQIVQTPDWLVTVSERNHATRIVPLGTRNARAAQGQLLEYACHEGTTPCRPSCPVDRRRKRRTAGGSGPQRNVASFWRIAARQTGQ